jgi:hypothetical protein
MAIEAMFVSYLGTLKVLIPNFKPKMFFSFFLIGGKRFPRIVRPIDLVPTCLYKEEVLVVVDGYSELTVGYSQGILGNQLRSHPTHLLIIIILVNY